MKRIFAPLFLLLISAGLALGDDFKSVTIPAFSTSDTFRVHNGQFMVVRNFTQEDGSTRGLVYVTKPPSTGPTVAVLAAALLNAFFLEPINNVVIAGPADVYFTCGDTSGNCFASFKKDNN